MTNFINLNKFRIFTHSFKQLNKFIISQMSTEDKSMDSSAKWFTRGRVVENAPEGVFIGMLDRFNGITIDSNIEGYVEDFNEKLEKSLEHWLEVKRRGIWFRVHKDASDWVPVLAKNGFDFHHAKKQFVMMCRWLPINEIEGFPPYCHTMIGVGAIVVNDKNEVLVVHEKNSLIPNMWKLPGGYVEPSENISDAAIREIEEETNVKTNFESIVCIRHAHGGSFGCSDLYIVVSLKPISTEIIKCDREIADCKWMDVNEYLNHPNVHETNRNFLRAYIAICENGVKIECSDAEHPLLRRKYQMYDIVYNNTKPSSRL